MKKLIPAILLSALMASSAVAVAGPGKGKGFDGKKRLDYLTEQLELTEEQVTAIKSLHESKRANADDRRKGRKGPRDGGIRQLDPMASDYDEKVAALAAEASEKAREKVLERAEMHKAFMEILTEEQREELAELRAKRQEERAGKRQ